MFGVTSTKHNTMYFLTEKPAESPDLIVEEGVEIIPLDTSAGVNWRMGEKPPRRVLCRSRRDPRSYQELDQRRGIDRAEFDEVGKNFGGIMSLDQYVRHRGEVQERVRQLAETIKALDSITDDPDTDWDDNPFDRGAAAETDRGVAK